MNSQNSPRIGVVGKGFVGGAVYDSFFCPKDFCDPALGGSLTLKKLVQFSNYIFVCVPTPTVDNKLDASIVIDVCREINDWAYAFSKNQAVVIKSTVTPDVLELLENELNNIRLVFNPEFLTEANSYEDYIHPDALIFGADESGSDLVRPLLELYEHYSYMKMPKEIIETSLSTASLIKYGRNTFLAMKVIFFNDLKETINEVEMRQDYNIEWDKVVEGIASDPRIGKSHTQVPGPDGKNGYGGSCFPKDIKALIDFAYSHGSVLDLLEEVDRLNERKYGRREDTR